MLADRRGVDVGAPPSEGLLAGVGVAGGGVRGRAVQASAAIFDVGDPLTVLVRVAGVRAVAFRAATGTLRAALRGLGASLVPGAGVARVMGGGQGAAVAYVWR